MKTENIDSLISFSDYFNSEEKCISYLEKVRWSGGVYCPHCFGNKVYSFKNSINHKCADKRCGKKFNIKTNSIFEGTKLSLRKWFIAIYLFSTNKKGVSSVQISKSVSVTQKTGWFMLHRIRKMFSDCIQARSIVGTIEADETFVGGKNKNRHADKKIKYSQGRSFKDKTPVLGLLNRDTKQVYTFVVRNTSRQEIQPIVYQYVVHGSVFYSDEWSAYKGLNSVYNHEFIDHSRKQYVNGNVHTNTIEGFWSHLKRGLIGTYHSVSRKHLQKYCDEFSFKYNNCRESIGRIFSITIENSFNKRLKYTELIS